MPMESLTRAAPPAIKILSLRTWPIFQHLQIKHLWSGSPQCDNQIIKQLNTNPPKNNCQKPCIVQYLDRTVLQINCLTNCKTHSSKKLKQSIAKSYKRYNKELVIPKLEKMLSRTHNVKQHPKQRNCTYYDGDHNSDHFCTRMLPNTTRTTTLLQLSEWAQIIYSKMFLQAVLHEV